MTHFPHFIRDDSGAVTVDWTVLAAAVVGLGVASVGAVRSGVVSLGGDVEASLSNASVVALGLLGDAVSGALAAWEPLYFSNFAERIEFGNSILFANWPDESILSYYDSLRENVVENVADASVRHRTAEYLDRLALLLIVGQERGLIMNETFVDYMGVTRSDSIYDLLELHNATTYEHPDYDLVFSNSF